MDDRSLCSLGRKDDGRRRAERNEAFPKGTLDVAVRPTGETWQVSNDENGIGELVGRLRRLTPTLLVCEATGGYERVVQAKPHVR